MKVLLDLDTGVDDALALLYLADAHRRGQLQRIVLMGGSLTGGNATPTAEANVFNDPEAARIVFSSGAAITMVGLDVTHQTYLEAADLAPLEQQGGGRARLALRFMRHLMESYRRLGRAPRCVLHDPLAAGVCLDPSLVRTRKLAVDVETRGELTRGMTVADRRPAPAGTAAVDVALEVDAKRFEAGFLEALLRWAAPAPRAIGRPASERLAA